MPNYPTPQIIIGRPSTGQQGDSSSQAYSKYNIHTHAINQASNPLLLGIKPGFIVTGTNEFGANIFGTCTVVDINSTRITLSSNPLISSLKPTITFTDNTNSSNGITVTNLTTSVTSPILSLPNTSGGSLSDSQAAYLPVQNFSGFINLSVPLTNRTFPIIINNLNKSYLYKIDLQLLTINPATASASIGILINDNTPIYTELLNTAKVSTYLDLNTSSYSSLVDVNDTVKLYARALVSTQSTVLLAYNLYLHRV